MSTNTLTITACDNELLVVAYQWDASFEIANIKSGQNLPVDVTISITEGQFSDPINLNGVDNPLTGTYPATLPASSESYSLALVGINWGGATQFAAELDGQPIQGPIGPGPGVVWTPSVMSFKVS